MKPLTFLMMCTAAGASLTLVAGASAARITQPGQTTTIIGERVVAEAARSVRVPYGDLDLVAASGERTLFRRVKGAARSVCAPNDDQLVYRPFSTCVTEASDGARPQIVLAVRRAREIAHRGTRSIPLVANAVAGVR